MDGKHSNALICFLSVVMISAIAVIVMSFLELNEDTSLLDGTTCGKDCLLCEYAEQCTDIIGPTKCFDGTFLVKLPADETGRTNYCQDCKSSQEDMGVICEKTQGRCSEGWWFEPGDYGHTLMYNETRGNCIKCGTDQVCSELNEPV